MRAISDQAGSKLIPSLMEFQFIEVKFLRPFATRPERTGAGRVALRVFQW
jgi:hypothetical protein